MSRLVDMLLQAGALTPERAKEARGHQVVFGDRIGTNLLALGFINEITLAQALGALHQHAFAAGPDADTRPVLTRTLPRLMAARLSVVPARVEDEGVTVFCMDPLTTAAHEELQAHFKRRVGSVIVAEARMWALLHKFYLVKRGMRALHLDDDGAKRTQIKPRSADRQASSVATTVPLENIPAPSTTQPSLAALNALENLPLAPVRPAARPVDTAWLNSMLPAAAPTTTTTTTTQPPAPVIRPAATPAQPPTLTLPPMPLPPMSLPPAMARGAPMGAANAPTPAAAGVRVAPSSWLPVVAKAEESARFDELVALEIPILSPLTLSSSPPTDLEPVEVAPAWSAQPPPSSSSLSGRPVFAEADLSFDELIEETLVEEAAILVLGELVDGVPVADVAEVEEQETSPLNFDEAKAALGGVEDRNSIARIVLRYAMSRVKRAVLLTVQGRKGAEEALGWDALGKGIHPGLVHDICLDLQEPSTLKLAKENRAHVLGPLSKSTINDELVALLGGGAPKSVFVMPIVARGRVVNLLYLDNGPGRFMEPDIGELLILCQHINKSYDKLLSKAA
ncbi:MAG: hypothetical protein Q8O67_12480 [Deltaproteobacteria bacterium]|nr:hypothetical protein [Deltaproteobacteria bacterium]